jgi:hypothetical protein
LRAQIVPAQRGRGAADAAGQGRATPKHVSMSWAQRLKRVFGIEIESCEHTWTPLYAKRFFSVLTYR